jgi:hypothetical protein
MSYKKLIIFLLILSLALISTGCLAKLIPTTPSVAPPGTAGVLYLEPANLTLTPSEDFTVELKVTSITDLKGYSVTLSYDPTLISLQEVTEGSFFSAKGKTFFYTKEDNNTILIDCALLGKTLSISGEGTLATLSFTCLKAGSTNIEFSLAKTRDTLNKEIVTTKRNTKLKSK